MKQCSLIVFCVVFASATANAQSKYALELMGGETLDIDNLLGSSGIGSSAGIGAAVHLGPEVDLTANALFSQYPDRSSWGDGVASQTTVVSSGSKYSYTCAISIGPRIHAHALRWLSPYTLLQVGVCFLRTGMTSIARTYSAVPLAVGEFFTVHTTERSGTYLIGSLGIGLKVIPTDLFSINLEAKVQTLMGKRSSAGALVPLLTSVELPF